MEINTASVLEYFACNEQVFGSSCESNAIYIISVLEEEPVFLVQINDCAMPGTEVSCWYLPRAVDLAESRVYRAT